MNTPPHPPTQWKTSEPVPVGWMKQFYYFSELYDKISQIPGQIVECGVGEGNTLAMLAFLAGNEMDNRIAPCERRIWGFDSFEGFPEPSEFDQSPRNPQKGEWAIPQESVWKRLNDSGLFKTFPNLKVNIVAGFFERTLCTFGDEPIAFLHLDCDLYPSYKIAMELLFPKVAVGGIVCFDEYMELKSYPEIGVKEKWPGCTKAINDYLQNNDQYLSYYPTTRKYYMVKA